MKTNSYPVNNFEGQFKPEGNWCFAYFVDNNVSQAGCKINDLRAKLNRDYKAPLYSGGKAGAIRFCRGN